jgi:tetratricopeptide (TPR) repeat protein
MLFVRPNHANLPALVRHLAQQKRLDEIATVLETLERNQPIQQVSDWQVILNAFEFLPDSSKTQNPSLAFWYASALIGTRSFHLIEQLPPTIQPPLLAARAWLFLHQKNSLEAQSLLLQVMPHLSGRMLTFAQTHLARANFALGLEWQSGFQTAKQTATGRVRAFCLLDEATCYAHSGDTTTARTLWLEALPLFKSDPYHLAWLRYNLGISSAKDLIPDAERHFHELQRLAQKPDLKAWQSRAWSGFGVTHRVRGEWQRAIYAYQRAQSTALEPDDHIEATSSLALTLRLADRIPEALEVLACSPHQSPALAVQQAACYLAAQDPRRAKIILQTLQPQTAADHIRAAYCHAELGRLEPDLSAIVCHLESVPPTNLIAREEATHWHALRSLLHLINRPAPTPLEYTQTLSVSVYALGGLRVLVNARPVHLEPRSAELLLLLLERGGVAQVASLAPLLFPESKPSTAQSNVRRVLVQLRDALSWSGAVELDNKTLLLDRNAQWFYDLTEARAKGYAHAEFLPGMDKPWMLEVAAGVRLLGRNKPRA